MLRVHPEVSERNTGQLRTPLNLKAMLHSRWPTPNEPYPGWHGSAILNLWFTLTSSQTKLANEDWMQ